MRDQSTLPTTGTCLWRYRVRKEIGQAEASKLQKQKVLIFSPLAAANDPFKIPTENTINNCYSTKHHLERLKTYNRLLSKQMQANKAQSIVEQANKTGKQSKQNKHI